MENFVKPKLKRDTGSKTTTVNVYETINSFGIRGYKSKTFVLKAVTNALHFRIEYSMDGTSWYLRLDDIAVSAGGFLVREDVTNSELRGHFGFCRVSVKPQVAGSHGTGTYEFEGSTL